MCRLSLDTAESIPLGMRRLFWHQLMLASNAENQRDGSGMTDGVHIYKSHMPFLNTGANWIPRLNKDAVWLGHVRSASRNTEISPYAAHPFRFTLADGRVLICAHNGFINGMAKSEIGEPKVDSYQAFKLLVVLLNASLIDAPSGNITTQIINAWTAQFGVDSEWTFMFYLDDVATIVRGNRSMFYMPINDGFIFNTSESVLLHLKEWITGFWPGDYILGKITKIDEFSLCHLKTTTVEFTPQKINAQAMTPIYDSALYYQYADNTERLVK